ncbi:putative ribonuclease H-like domain-containing protein [Tanacetum coccineum]
MQVQKHVTMQNSKDSPDAEFKPSGEEEKIDTEDLGNENAASGKDSEVPSTEDQRVNQELDASINSTNNINAASDGKNTNNVNDAVTEVNVVDPKTSIELPNDLNMPELEDIVYSDNDEDVGVEADMNNFDAFMPVSHIPTIRIHKDHSVEQIIIDLNSAPQIRRMTKNLKEHGLFSLVQQRINHKDFQNCLFAFFLSQEEPKKMDVKSAFLYGKIEEEVYVCQPPGFEDPEFSDRVYKVEKALYGLHQAPKAGDQGDILIVQIYLDDIIFGSTKKKLCTEFEKMMHKKFQMSSMGELTFFLGLQVKQKEDRIFISQDKYVTEILNKFSFSDVKTASTPMETHKPLLKDVDGEDVDEHMYRLMIGSLMYFTSSRPDIMFICSYARSILDRQSTDRRLSFLAIWAIVKVKTINGKLSLQVLEDGKEVSITETSVKNVEVVSNSNGIQGCGGKDSLLEQLQPLLSPLAGSELKKKWVEIVQLCQLDSPSHNAHGCVCISTHLPSGPVHPAIRNKRTRERKPHEGLGDQEDASKQGRKITDIDQNAEVILVDETQGRIDENLLWLSSNWLNEDAKTKVVEYKQGAIQKQEHEQAPTLIVSSQQPTQVKDKGKGKMVEEEPMKKMSKKEQIRLDEELAFKLQVEEEQQARLAREKAKKVKEANISWDNVQAMIEADRLLAERLQAREQEELTNEEKARLFVELLEKRKKHFAALRAQEKRNKPPTKAQKKSTMLTYLKHMASYKQNTELVKESSKKAEVEMAEESSSKRAREELEQEVAKKQKMEDDKEKEDLKQCFEIVHDDEVAIDVIPLATKPSPIVNF